MENSNNLFTPKSSENALIFNLKIPATIRPWYIVISDMAEVIISTCSKTINRKILVIIFLMAIICSCQEVENGMNSLITTVDEPSGSNCDFGGLRVDSGLDINENNILDESEVISSRYLCNESSGTQERQIRLRLDNDKSFFVESKTWLTDLFNFDLSDYSEIDSVVVVYKNVYVVDAGNELVLELYDLTNDKTIEQSTVVITNTFEDSGEGIVFSKNLFNIFPDGRIDIGIKGKVVNNLQEKEDAYGGYQSAYLMLIRK